MIGVILAIQGPAAVGQFLSHLVLEGKVWARQNSALMASRSRVKDLVSTPGEVIMRNGMGSGSE